MLATTARQGSGCDVLVAMTVSWASVLFCTGSFVVMMGLDTIAEWDIPTNGYRCIISTN